MIKKIFHYICVVVFGILWSAVLGALFMLLFYYECKSGFVDFSKYQNFSEYWSVKGGALYGNDFLMIFSMLLYFPLCIYGWFKLAHYKFMRLITVPLNKIANSGLDNYRPPDVNIKNLKVEEKKTLEQIVQERLEKEKKKNPTQNAGSSDFRKIIIDKIEENKK